MSRTFVASAGEMTLYMELYDSLTSDKIAEVMDAEAVLEDRFETKGIPLSKNHDWF